MCNPNCVLVPMNNVITKNHIANKFIAISMCASVFTIDFKRLIGRKSIVSFAIVQLYLLNTNEFCICLARFKYVA
jgi:hypothetical protein